LFGVLLGVLWIVVSPADYEVSTFRFFCCFAISIVAGFAYIGRRKYIYQPNSARCPACGYSWEILEGRGVPLDDRMENWAFCPGCGMPMADEVLKLVLTDHSNL
jgi:hypothetical protein